MAQPVTDPDLLRILNGGDAAPAPGPGGAVYGAPPAPKEPKEPKTTYRPLSPDEVKANNLDPAGSYQISSEGKIDVVKEPPKPVTKTVSVDEMRANTRNLLLGAGIDLEKGQDPILPLIAGSTSGKLQHMGADAYGAVTGDATSGMEKIGRLQTIVNDMVLQMSGGSLGNQISNSDRDFIAARMGDIGNPDIPANQRVASWNQVKQRFANILGVKIPEAPVSDQAPAGKEIVAYQRNPDGTLVPIYADTGSGGGSPPPDGGSGGGGFFPSAAEIGQGIAQGTGSMVAGLGDVAGIIGNPLNATINAATGSNLSTDLGGSLRDIFGLPKNTTGTDAIIRAGTSAGGVGMAAKGAAALVNPGIARNALTVLGRSPGADVVGGVGAGAGMDMAKRNELGTGGQIVAAMIGGLAGYGGVNALAGTRGSNALASAAERQQVSMLPADAGGPVARIVTSATKASPLSAAPVVNAAQKATASLSQAASRAATNEGAVLTTDAAGTGIRAAAERFTKQTAERAGRMYDRANQMAGDLKVVPQQTMAAIDEQLARLSQNPAADGGIVKQLQALRTSIAQGVSVQGLRDARTALSQGVYNGQLRGNQDQAMFKQILGNVSKDIDAGLRQAGKDDAANAFTAADKFWSARVDHIDQVLQPILGKGKGGEEVLQAVESMARGGKGGASRLARLLGNMTPDEAGSIRATIIDRIGKATPGAQNAEGNAFSPGTFLTNWNKMTPQAKASLFSDTATRRNLDDIALLAERMKATQAMANHSNTGAALVGNTGAGVGLAVSHPVAAVLGAGAQYLTGRLMASPAFTRILLRTAKMPDQPAVRSFTDQLAVLGTREPMLATDAKALQDYLKQSFGQSPGRAAATDQESDGRRKPPAN